MSKFICSADRSGGSETDKLEASETMPRPEEGEVCTSTAVQVWTQAGVCSRHQQAALFALIEQILELQFGKLSGDTSSNVGKGKGLAAERRG